MLLYLSMHRGSLSLSLPLFRKVSLSLLLFRRRLSKQTASSVCASTVNTKQSTAVQINFNPPQTIGRTRQHCRLSTCENWLSWTNTNTVSEQKIPITILILKRGPCLGRIQVQVFEVMAEARVTLIVALPPILTSFRMISSQILHFLPSRMAGWSN